MNSLFERAVLFAIAMLAALLSIRCAAATDGAVADPPVAAPSTDYEALFELANLESARLSDELPRGSSLAAVAVHLGRAPLDQWPAISLGSEREGRSLYRWQARYLWILHHSEGAELALICNFDNLGGPFGSHLALDGVFVFPVSVALAFKASESGVGREEVGDAEFDAREKAAREAARSLALASHVPGS